jgi:hypothetical protein
VTSVSIDYQIIESTGCWCLLPYTANNSAEPGHLPSIWTRASWTMAKSTPYRIARTGPVGTIHRRQWMRCGRTLLVLFLLSVMSIMWGAWSYLFMRSRALKSVTDASSLLTKDLGDSQLLLPLPNPQIAAQPRIRVSNECIRNRWYDQEADGRCYLAQLAEVTAATGGDPMSTANLCWGYAPPLEAPFDVGIPRPREQRIRSPRVCARY